MSVGAEGGGGGSRGRRGQGGDGRGKGARRRRGWQEEGLVGDESKGGGDTWRREQGGGNKSPRRQGRGELEKRAGEGACLPIACPAARDGDKGDSDRGDKKVFRQGYSKHESKPYGADGKVENKDFEHVYKRVTTLCTQVRYFILKRSRHLIKYGS